MARVYAQTCLATILPEDIGYDAYVPEGMEVALDSVTVTKLPTKTSYVTGQEISFAGLEVTANYSNGSKEVVVPDSIKYDTSKTGSVPVTVVYNGKTATFNITVSPKIVSSISVTAPNTTEFHAGEELDLSGGKVKVVYESIDGFSETFALDSSMISGYSKDKVGKQTVTVTYGGKTASFEVETYVKYTDMYVLPAPGSGYVYVGEELYLGNYIVNVICEDYPQFSKSVSLERSMIINDIDTETPGYHSVTVSYEGMTFDFGYIVVVKGDVDGDGKITMMDVFRMKLFVKQLIAPSHENIYDMEADINGDGYINMVDVFELKYRVKTGAWR
jgi:hypothetical protein